MSQEQLFNLGRRIADEVAQAIVTLSRTRELGDEIGTVGAGGDKTKFADQLAEDVVKRAVSGYREQEHVPKIVVIAEETGVTVFGDDAASEGCFIILDPVDGSNNLRRWKTPSPNISVSVALGTLERLRTHDNFDAIETAFVRDIFNGRTYIAQSGAPAYVTDFGQLTPSPVTSIDEMILGADLDAQGEAFEDLYASIEELLKRCACQRRIGSSILDFMKVAAGEHDAFISLAGRMKLHDVAAAQLIVRNAKGEFRLTSPPLDFCLIKRLIETKDNSLINSRRFNIIAAGNAALADAIADALR